MLLSWFHLLIVLINNLCLLFNCYMRVYILFLNFSTNNLYSKLKIYVYIRQWKVSLANTRNPMLRDRSYIYLYLLVLYLTTLNVEWYYYFSVSLFVSLCIKTNVSLFVPYASLYCLIDFREIWYTRVFGYSVYFGGTYFVIEYCGKPNKCMCTSSIRVTI